MNKKLLSSRVPVAIGAAFLIAVGGVSVAIWQVRQMAARKTPSHPARLVYQAGGYGGYRTVASSATVGAGAAKIAPSPKPVSPATPDPLASALVAYGKGRFGEAESAAQATLARSSSVVHPDVPARRTATKALHLLAFTAAREHNLTLARERFAQEKTEAATLPDHGKPVEKPALGADPDPTFEENAAYQHAVCTAALGDKAGAEAEYTAFMRQYPDSPLLQAAVKRISWMHGGNIPKEAEAVWEASMKTAQAHEKARERDESLCGPACLAELLRREGRTATADSTAALANEMHTSERGTTLLGLQTIARRHGFPGAQGVALTMKGLGEQSLPVIALIQPGHYVLIESIESARNGTVEGLRVWDPDAKGLNAGGTLTVPARQWTMAWRGGVALTLRPPVKAATVQVALTPLPPSLASERGGTGNR